MNTNNENQLKLMREAINKVTSLGSCFLSHKIPAEEMAESMVEAVKEYARESERVGSIQPKDEETKMLLEALREIMGCGSGFLANRCDAACVERTITYIIDEFSED